ncbi:MAG TPA: phospholipid carrier-dependent glycosyltransferase [Candidatus Acidoferrum sp.]|nr:phospholipid carrier-dependent glycosyltransferase [Candidatus Acidoferrum sp.]
MSESPTAIAEKPQSNSVARIGWAILIFATLCVCYFSHLGAIGFVGPDEPRYAWIARDMTETGDWVTPRLYGKPWFEKPPLFYWGAAVCFKLFGVSETAARLPSAISALLATLALAWLALRLYGAETARWLLLLLPTTVGMIGFSHAAATDMPFSGMLIIAMVCAAVVLGLTRDENTPILPRTPWLALILFGFFLGLAVLAKGPAAIILSGGAVFFWALFTKCWRDGFRLFHPAAIAAFCLTALPWYILCARRNPDFFRIFIIEHNFKRFLTPEFQHIHPFWFYVPVIILAVLPWTGSAARLKLTTKAPSEPGDWLNSPSLFFGCWVMFPIVFFTLSKSKLPGYILPTIPALGLLMAQNVSLCIRGIIPGDRWIRITSGTTFIVLGILGIVQIEGTDLIWPALAVATGGFAILVIRDLRFGLSLGVSALIIAIASSLTGNTGAVLDQRYSARSAAEAARIVWNNYSPDRSSTYKLTRSFQYGLNFYFHRELPEWTPDGTAPGWVFALAKDEGELRNRGLTCPFNALRHAVIVCENGGLTIGRSSGGQSK